MRAIHAPTALPIPRPHRKTAAIIENVYTVPPSSSDNTRVHTTSAPRAPMPDRPIAAYTPHVARAGSGSPAAASVAAYGVRVASSTATIATATLMAAATYVATAMSYTRSR